MVEVQGNELGQTPNPEHAYWEETSSDNRGVYSGFVTLLKISIVLGALALIVLAIVRPEPL